MTAVYPGSFDPVTNGHLDIIRRAAAISDRLIVGLLVNPHKKSMFTPDERLRQLEAVTGGMGNVAVKFFSGFLHDFAGENGASVIIRGIRGSVIPEYEVQSVLARMGRAETLFMFSRPEYMHISSTLVKEIISGGGGFEEMVPPAVIPDIRGRMKTF